MRIGHFSIVSMLLLAGCATVTPAQRAEFWNTVPVCSSEVECRAKWEAAQLWISQNLGLKIQTVTPVIIQTYGPGQNGAVTAAQIIKEPIDGRSYRILIQPYCNNPLGCFPPIIDAALAFNRYVNTVPVSEPAE